MTNYPKILFLTVNGWNNTTGTGTISSIIKGYPEECVADIFIRADMPNSETCDKYFRINEINVFKSIFKRRLVTGYEVKKITQADNQNFKNDRTVQNKLKKYRNSLTPYIREFAWKLGKWKSAELKKFILDFDPDLIIFPAEALIHFNNIGLFAAELTNKPFGLFFWDDNFTYIPVKGFLPKLYRAFLRRNIKRAAQKADFAFAINPKMQKECYEHLGIRAELLTKPIVTKQDIKPYVKERENINILYTGSIYIDRDKTILMLIDAIKTINVNGGDFFLKIYTNSSLSEDLEKKLNIQGVSQVYPAVAREEVLKLQREADILLFAEALQGKYRNAARLSFSTKITDYFSARRCILAIAPADIAPMEYLCENDISLTADSVDKIYDVLKTVVNNPDILEEYAEKAYNFGLENHSQKIIFDKFVKCITEADKTKPYKENAL